MQWMKNSRQIGNQRENNSIQLGKELISKKGFDWMEYKDW